PACRPVPSAGRPAVAPGGSGRRNRGPRSGAPGRPATGRRASEAGGALPGGLGPFGGPLRPLPVAGCSGELLVLDLRLRARVRLGGSPCRGSSPAVSGIQVGHTDEPGLLVDRRGRVRRAP